MSDEQRFFNICVPNEFQNASLETCNKIPANLIEFGKKWAGKDWINNPKSLFICGGMGNGKTTYALSLVRQVFRNWKGVWPRYYETVDLDAALLQASKSDEGDSYLIEKLSEADLLVIDDVGRESDTDRLRRQYFRLFNKRHTSRKPTIITTNLDIQTIGKHVSDAIASRMQEWEEIIFMGKDLRSGD